MTKTILLAGVAMLALPGVAAAQTAVPATTPTDQPVSGDQPPTADPQDVEGDEVVVLGFGRSRQIQEVTATDIARLAPGTSPIKAIQKLPGINIQAADPFGNYEWAVRISLRGFAQNQLGFTLDDVPLGDMSYGNVNGLHISRALISENIGRTEVAQGAGALSTASSSNLGGTVQFYSSAPTNTVGIKASGTYGSNDLYRGFLRLDTGYLGDSGVKGYLSYAYNQTDKWKGFGEQRQHQANAKLVKDLGDQGDITAFFNFSDRRETDYQDLSYPLIARRGANIDNFTRPSDYATAVALSKAAQNQAAGRIVWAGAPAALPAGVTLDDQYFDAGGVRQDYLGGITFNGKLTPELSLKATGYYHHNKGQGSWITPFATTPVGALDQNGSPIATSVPMAFRTTEYRMGRGGALARLAWEKGPNTLAIGGWVEANSFNHARRFYGMTDTATPNRVTLEFQKNPFRTQWEGHYSTDTLQYNVEDTLKLLDDRLVLNGGWKGLKVTNQANMKVAGALAAGKIGVKDMFLPQVGALYKLAAGAELFAAYAENVRAFVSAGALGPFSTTQAGFNGIRASLKPEKSRSVEGGLRFRDSRLQASAVGYYVRFDDRLLTFQNGAGILGNPPTLNNVGAVNTYGAELSANYRILPPFSVFASYSYTHSEYAADVRNAAGALVSPTKGKQTVDTPKHMIKGEIVYDDDTFMARIGADYMSKRFITYSNDRSAGDRVVLDASLGYTFHGEGFVDGLGVTLNVTNLTDKDYIGVIGTNGFISSGDSQTFQNSPPRQWFVSLRKGF